MFSIWLHVTRTAKFILQLFVYLGSDTLTRLIKCIMLHCNLYSIKMHWFPLLSFHASTARERTWPPSDEDCFISLHVLPTAGRMTGPRFLRTIYIGLRWIISCSFFSGLRFLRSLKIFILETQSFLPENLCLGL